MCWGATVTNIHFDVETMNQTMVEFCYNTNNYVVINDIPHWPATVVVSRKQNSEFYVIDTFNGFYTEHRCWEDTLDDIVRKAEGVK